MDRRYTPTLEELDKGNIEDLGFFEKDKFIYYNKDKTIQLNYNIENNPNLRIIDEEWGDQIFLGNINNKSELYKLFKWLRING